MANLGSTDTPAAVESLDLPNGYSPAFEEDSGDLVINDPNGNTALRWDATNGEWNANSNDVTNIGALETEESVTVTGDDTVTYGRDHGNVFQGTAVAVGVGARANANADFAVDDPRSVAVGFDAARNDERFGVVAVGYEASKSSDGFGLTAVGYSSGAENTGEYCVAVGYSALNTNTGGRSTAVGYIAGANNTGTSITALGFAAARDNTAEDVTAIGYNAGRENTGQETVLVGRKSGWYNTGNNTVAVGYKAAQGGNLSDPSTMGDRNVGVGYEAIENNQASGLIAIGFRAGKTAQTDDQLIITQRDGTRRMVMDLTTGDLQITGELTENASL